MKTIITILFAVITTTAFSSKYEETMKASIEKMYQLHSPEKLQALANQFERIGNTEPGEWLPRYYAAYCFVLSTFFGEMNTDTKQTELDKAQRFIDELLKTHEKESEIYALQALLFQLRITDMSKGALYSPKAAKAIATAEKLNPENLRVYYLRGSNTFHTPIFFGGGTEKARPDPGKAAQMFKNSKPVNTLMPN